MDEKKMNANKLMDEEKITAAYNDIRQEISQAKNETDAISAILRYAAKNNVKFVGVDLKATGSVTFIVKYFGEKNKKSKKVFRLTKRFFTLPLKPA